MSTGHIRRGSDIDLHVFTDDASALTAWARRLGWRFSTERVSILKFGEVREYLHLHVEDDFDVELTVYERRELRFRPRSSTDGEPIVRVKPDALEALIAAEHTDAWRRYLADGTLTGLNEDDDDGVHDLASWDGLLDDDAPDPEALPTDEELAGDTLPYAPLPGFEDV